VTTKVLVGRFCGVSIVLFLAAQVLFASSMPTPAGRQVSGVIVDPKGQVLNGVTVIARGTTGERRAVTNEAGQFTLEVPNEDVSLWVQGQYIKPYQRDLPLATPMEPLKIEIEYFIPRFITALLSRLQHWSLKARPAVTRSTGESPT
jgi:hypothetical protein